MPWELEAFGAGENKTSIRILAEASARNRRSLILNRMGRDNSADDRSFSDSTLGLLR